MAEATEAASTAKKKTEVLSVVMEDGRKVDFAGKRKLVKETLFDETKIALDGNTVTVEDGAVSIRMNFRNGKVRVYPIKAKLFAKFAGHGGEQKYGDELATTADKPLTEDDMVVAVDDLHEQLWVRETWREASEGGGVAGASVVIMALVEASGKTIEQVKQFLQGKLDAAKAKNEKLSRKELYDSFRNPNTKVGQIVKRMEEERLAKSSKVDADSALGELGTASA